MNQSALDRLESLCGFYAGRAKAEERIRLGLNTLAAAIALDKQRIENQHQTPILKEKD